MIILLEGGNVDPNLAEGTSNIILSYAQALRKHRHKVVLLTRRRGMRTGEMYMPYEVKGGIIIYRWSNYLDLLRLYLKIKRKERVDIIHIFAKGLRPAAYFLLIKAIIRLPIVFSVLGWPFLKEKLTERGARSARRSFGQADRVLVSSKSILSELLAITRLRNFSYLPFGVDTEVFKSCRVAPRRCNIRCFRGLSRNVLAALERLSLEVKDLRVVTDSRLDLPSTPSINIDAVGFVADIPKLLKQSDLFLDIGRIKYNHLASASPPLAILEAMSCKIPVISSKIPEIEEVIDNRKNGFLVETCNEAEIYKAMKLALSPKAASVCKEARKTIVDRYSWSALLPKYEAIYNDLLLKKRKYYKY